MAEATEVQEEKKNLKKIKGRLEVGWKWHCSPSQQENKEPFQAICRAGLFVSLQHRRFQWDALEIKGKDALPGRLEWDAIVPKRRVVVAGKAGMREQKRWGCFIRSDLQNASMGVIAGKQQCF